MRKALVAPLTCALVTFTSIASAQDREPAPNAQPSQAEPATAQPQQAAEPPDSTSASGAGAGPRAVLGSEEAQPAERPADKPLFRDEGLVLGLDFGFGRSIGDAVDRLNAGSPTQLPVGISGSFRTSQKVMFGMHAHAALASREDCTTSGGTNCTARDYGIGAHVETALGTPGPTVVPWFRYGVGWEMLYRGGFAGYNDAYAYRHALKLIDARFGADFVVHRSESGKTTRIGPFLGLVTGVTVGDYGSYNAGGLRADLDRPNGDVHFWFLLGLRATTDP
jgi:hypothetical protein